MASADAPALLAQEVEPVREVVIGAAANLPLTLIGPLTVLEDSTLVVSQPLETRVKVLDWTAQRVTDVGRAGAGPGEFRFMNGLGSSPGAGFWVWDAGHRRISVFAADGALRKTIPAERTGLSRILLFLPPDTVVVLRRSPEMHGEVVSVGARDGQSGRRWLEYPIVSRPSLRYELPGFDRTASGSNPFRDAPIVRGAADGSGIVHVARQVATAGSAISSRSRYFEGIAPSSRAP